MKQRPTDLAERCKRDRERGPLVAASDQNTPNSMSTKIRLIGTPRSQRTIGIEVSMCCRKANPVGTPKFRSGQADDTGEIRRPKGRRRPDATDI
jgi:hypothetical protein